MWGLCRMVLGLGLVVVLAQPALAQRQKQKQRPQGQRGPMTQQGGVAALLKSESVQKELKLDADQVDKVKAAVQKVEENHKGDFAKLKDASQEERRSKGRELTQSVSTETLTAVGDILKPEQMKRLKQIELQRAGEEAFRRPEVQKALNLTAAQTESLKTITSDAAKETRDLFSGGAGQGAREKIAALRKQTSEKIQGILNEDQKKTWKELTGEPFQMQTRTRRPNQQ